MIVELFNYQLFKKFYLVYLNQQNQFKTNYYD